MKKLRPFILMLVCVFSALAQSTLVAQTAGVLGKGDLHYSLRLDKESYIEGEPIELLCTIQNRGTAPVELFIWILSQDISVDGVTKSKPATVADTLEQGHRLLPGESLRKSFFLNQCLPHLHEGAFSLRIPISISYGQASLNSVTTRIHHNPLIVINAGNSEDMQALVEKARSRLESVDQQTRQTAAAYLAEVPNKYANKALVQGLKDYDPIVVSACLRGLNRRPFEWHRNEVLSLLADAKIRASTKQRILRYVMNNREHIPDDEIRDAISTLLEQQTDGPLVFECLISLDRVGIGSLKEDVVRLMESPSILIREQASKLIEKKGIGSKN